MRIDKVFIKVVSLKCVTPAMLGVTALVDLPKESMLEAYSSKSPN